MGHKDKGTDPDQGWLTPVAALLQPGEGFSVADVDADSTPGWSGKKKHAKRYLKGVGEELADLQERLYANGKKGDRRTVLLVLQGLDAAGKGGITRHVIGMVDPQGVALRSFGVPTEEERGHHYLWRIWKALPPAGRIGVFDRSHYEDVLVVKVDELAPPEVIAERYEEINDFERQLVESGTTIIKIGLVISPQEQFDRIFERLDRPDKHWKYNPGDLNTRARWAAYQEAYQLVLDRTSTSYAPWHIVPANHKWYARLAVSEILLQAMRGMGLTWPSADFDVAVEKDRLMAERDVDTLPQEDSEA